MSTPTEWVHNPRVRNTGVTSAAVSRTYTPPGKLYPRITLALYDYRTPIHYFSGVVVDVNMKWRHTSWWDQSPCPHALLEDLSEMIRTLAGAGA